jgi:hypothetical protein
MKKEIGENEMKRLLKDQQDEITAHHLYLKIAKVVKDEKNKKIIEHIARDEMDHYNRLRKVTGRNLNQEKGKITLFFWLVRIFGLTFGIRLLEKDEGKAVKSYSDDLQLFEEMKPMIEDEERHEEQLIEMIDEERLNYMGSVVLGLNDALVELTGALAGYTFAF